jgi:hypothetical protein
LRGILISICFGISVTGIELIDFINLAGGLFNCILAFIFPVYFWLIVFLDSLLYQAFFETREDQQNFQNFALWADGVGDNVQFGFWI